MHLQWFVEAVLQGENSLIWDICLIGEIFLCIFYGPIAKCKNKSVTPQSETIIAVCGFTASCHAHSNVDL